MLCHLGVLSWYRYAGHWRQRLSTAPTPGLLGSFTLVKEPQAASLSKNRDVLSPEQVTDIMALDLKAA